MSRHLKGTFSACVILAVVLFPAWSASGALIDIGNVFLDPNKAGQKRMFLIDGTEQVRGLDFYAQVGDGGPGSPDGGTVGPKMSAVSLENGIFFGNNQGQFTLILGGGLPQLQAYGINTNTGTVLADGIIVEITFDTTGFSSGEWDLLFTGTEEGDTELYAAQGAPAINLTINNGKLTVVPEPSTLVLGSIGLLGIAAISAARRRRVGSAAA
jgi:hypothetical protein